MTKLFVSAIKDQLFTDENEAYSRGYLAVYRRDGETVWTPCKEWVADGHGSGFYANFWRDTPQAAKEAAKRWLSKRGKGRAGA